MDMKRFQILGLAMILAGAVCLSSCTKQLDRNPPNTLTPANALSNVAGYKIFLAKVYGSFALTSSTGPGNTDLAGIDAGTSDFLRLFWNAEELPTDEAACIWNDPGVPDFHNMNWSSNNVILLGLYVRSLYQITVANQFIAQSSDAALSSKGITGEDATNIRYYRAEARFLRAYQYWVLINEFGNPPFVDENTPIGATLPKQIKRAALFSYIESELKAIDPLLMAPHKNEYGRADQAADWALLARLYLNAQVYTGTAHWADAVTYAQKVIAAGYPLMTNYANLFEADNNLNNTETILSINYDGTNTQNYGGTTFIINSSISAQMIPASFGLPNGGWAGNRATQSLPTLFTGSGEANDVRNMFFSKGHTLDMDTLQSFTSGYATTKFTNETSTGVAGNSTGGVFASTDFPLFRSAEMYLIIAEAALRNGDNATALTAYNVVRARAHAAVATSITLQDVLDERGREFYWEATRRTDLIRYGLFTSGDYLWAFKGGVVNGKSVEDFRNLYPLPANDITANPNLIQNKGY